MGPSADTRRRGPADAGLRADRADHAAHWLIRGPDAAAVLLVLALALAMAAVGGLVLAAQGDSCQMRMSGAWPICTIDGVTVHPEDMRPR
jgi:hypothetical protein